MEETGSRRRLVQSTLFPQMDSSIKESQHCNGVSGGEIEDEGGKWSGGSKKQNGSKRRNNSKPKATPRASSKKVTAHGGDTSSKQVHDSASPVIVTESTCFVKGPEKPRQNQPILIDSPEKNDGICSAPSSSSSTPQKLKRRNNSTPRKERKNSTLSKKLKNGQRGSCCGPIPFEQEVDEWPSPNIPNLRLEAKLTAEENSRIFAGRQIHPFFMSRKAGKTNQDLACLESNSSFGRMEKGIAFNPIHVFENDEENHGTLDWGHLVLSERTSTRDPECGCSRVYEGSVESINFDNLMNVSHLTQTSPCQSSHPYPFRQKEVSEELLDKVEFSHPFSSLSLADKIKNFNKHLKDAEILSGDAENVVTSAQAVSSDQGLSESDPFVGISCEKTLDSELQDKLLHERIMSHYHTSTNEPENRLWTDKYHPENAKQVCGNGESVRLLSEWLNLWHQKGSLTSRSSIGGDEFNLKDNDHDYQLTNSDSDTNDEESLKNVLLVTGPVGSGKSAAIYTCAREQGFQVIEINASDWRNGAVIKQKFGEAVESHWCRRTKESTTKSDRTPMTKVFKGDSAETCCPDNGAIDLIHLSDEDYHDADACNEVLRSGKNRTVSHQDDIKTVILFEDADATLCEDHGFITTIQQLSETAKRPMILTSNSGDPILPKNLDRLQLNFSAPSLEELLGLLHMICTAEKVEISPCILERFADYCRRDIRKTITLLQFWCQEHTFDKKITATYWPVLFDPDAAHHILPRVIHWVYPSQLSEIVAGKIFKSLVSMEESNDLVTTKRGKDINDCSAEIIHTQESETDHIELKKEAMLSLQCLHDDVNHASYEQLFDFTCSPVASPRQNGRRKVNTVLSSDSEDEFLGGNNSLVSEAVDVKKFKVPDLNTIPTSHCLSSEMHLQSVDPIYHTDVDKLEDYHQIPVEMEYCHLGDTCISHETSFVPESSFVPETEVINESQLHSVTISCGHLENAAVTSSIIQDHKSIPIPEPILTSEFVEPFPKTHNNEQRLGHIDDYSMTCIQIEEVADSASKSAVDVLVRYQVIDECSRVNFIRRLESSNNRESDQVIDFVQETWKRLHDQCKDLAKYVTAEERTTYKLLTFAHGISDVISAFDMLSKDCQPLISDFSEPAMFPDEKTHSQSYYDDQANMSSIFAQHGMCFYAKEMSNIGCTSSFDLASQMLSASASSIALGKLAGQDKTRTNGLDKETYRSFDLLRSKSKSPLCGLLQSVVPSKSYLAANGGAFHEYVSTLSQISRYEGSRLSKCLGDRKQRRSRVARHYLSSGSLNMSQEEISLLDGHNNYHRDFFAEQKDESF